MKRRIVLFCGGSGAYELVKTLSQLDDIELTILVNCYDDGLSTGKLRELIPGMLGPSDIRKNVKHSLRPENDDLAILDHILSFRFPDDIRTSTIQGRLAAILKALRPVGNLGDRRETLLVNSIERFLRYVEETGHTFSFRNVALGNILFSGIYLEHAHFNVAIRSFVEFFEIRNRILNLTDGTDLKLVALTDDHLILPNESAISSVASAKKIQDIFLLGDYLAAGEMQTIEKLGGTAKAEQLRAHCRVPRLNEEARDSILSADVIIYWPGTQHSSLFPSYLTDGLAETIAALGTCKKILVTNILKDNDICNETAFSLVEKFFWFMSRRGSVSNGMTSLVTDVVLNDPRIDLGRNILPLGTPQRSYPDAAIHIDEWNDSQGKHDIQKVLRRLS